MTRVIYRKYVRITGNNYREDNSDITILLDFNTLLRTLKKDGYILVTDDRGIEHIILTHMIMLIEQTVNSAS